MLPICQLFLDLSDQVVRHDNSSVHGQGSNIPSEMSTMQIRSKDKQHVQFQFACDGGVTTEKQYY
jgi:hypothetical protein